LDIIVKSTGGPGNTASSTRTVIIEADLHAVDGAQCGSGWRAKAMGRASLKRQIAAF
jgi:hypothetical protein